MYFYERYLDANPTDRIESRRIQIGRDVLESIGASARDELGRSARIWVLSDGNTDAAAGAVVRAALRAEGLAVVGPVLPSEPKPEPALSLCDELAADAKGADLVIAVGGGTISDIGKKVSADNGVPNWSVPTAPSVDAFTSAKSALRIRGYHRTPFVRPSGFVLCDLSVLESSPERLRRAGVGDLLAKYFAYLDWTLSSWVTGEDYDSADATYALESARRAVTAVREAGGVGGAVSEHVIDAALTSGLIMQKRRNSRAAASSEHTIAHFWEVAGAVSNEELDLHGLLVAGASRISLAAYSWFIGRLPSLDIACDELVARYRRSPAWHATIEGHMEPYRDKMEEEMADRDFSPEAYSARLKAIADRRVDIVRFAEPVLEELEEAVEALRRAGFPLDFGTLGLDRSKAWASVRYVRFLRNRYGIFDMAADAGVLPDLEGALTEQFDRWFEG